MGRLSKKRSDKRWEDEHGVWASKLESVVFGKLLQVPGIVVRRCSAEQGDTFDYHTPVRSGICRSCGGSDIVQQRTYTPDFHIRRSSGGGDERGYYLEVKGHFPGPKRNLLRSFLKTGPSIDLRILLERDGKATGSLTLLEYCVKFLKIPVHCWDGQLPKSWIEG